MSLKIKGIKLMQRHTLAVSQHDVGTVCFERSTIACRELNRVALLGKAMGDGAPDVRSRTQDEHCSASQISNLSDWEEAKLPFSARRPRNAAKLSVRLSAARSVAADMRASLAR